MKAIWAALALVALQPLGSQAMPRISIGALNDYFDSGKPVEVKRVANVGDATAFVKVRAWELVRDESGVSREVPLEGMAIEDRPLVVSPARLIIPAKGMQAVRLVFRGARDRERYFRLRFNPVLPEQGDGFALDAAEAKAYEQSISGGVQLMAGYGSILYVRPSNPIYDTRIDEQPDRFVVRNQGNTTVVLDRFRDCDPAGRECAQAVVHHLLPGAELRFQKLPGRIHHFVEHEGNRTRNRQIRG